MNDVCSWYRTDALAREVSQLTEVEISKFDDSGLIDVRPVVIPHPKDVIHANDYFMWPIATKVEGTLIVLYSRVPCHWGKDGGKGGGFSGIRMITTSDDGGRSWSEPVDILAAGKWKDSPFRLGVCGGGIGAHDGIVYVAIKEGVYRSADKGRTWELVSKSPQFGEHPFPVWAPGMRITFDESHGMIVWTNSGFPLRRKRGEYGNHLGAFYSPDFGTTWHYEKQPVPKEITLSEVTPLQFDGKMVFFLRNGLNNAHYAQAFSETGWFPFTFSVTNVGPVKLMDTPDVIYNPVTKRLEAAASHRKGLGSGPTGAMKVNLYSLSPEELAAGSAEWRFEGTLIRYRTVMGKSDGFNPVGSVVDAAAGVQHIHVWGGDGTGRAGIFQYTRSLDTPAVATYLKSFYKQNP